MDPDPTSSADEGLAADVRWLRMLAARVIGDAALADDACQEAWLALRRWDRGLADADAADGGKQRRSKMFRAMRRFAWRSRRAEARRAAREAQCASAEALPSTEELLSRGEHRRLLWRRLIELDEPYRTTLLLRFQEGLDTRAMAIRSQSPEDTVRRRIRRGLELLRERYRTDEAGGRGGMSSLAVAALPLGTSAAASSAASVGGMVVQPAVALMGAWMMKKSLIVALLLVAALVVGSVLWQPGGVAAPDERGQSSVALASAASSGLQRGGIAEPRAPVERAAAPAAPAAASAASAAASESAPFCRVFGKVVDASGAALVGAQVRLVCRRSQWASEHLWANEVSTAPDGSFEVRSDGLQERETVRLEVAPSPFHRRVVRTFGGEPDHDFGPANVAQIDVGSLRAAPAGAVAGRVVDARGVPVAGVRVDDDGSDETTRTARDGQFRLQHVALGENALSFVLAGYLEHEHALPPPPQGALLELGDVVLRDAPRVTGSVTDLAGNALVGATVSTRGFTRGWAFDAGAQATFDVPLPHAGPGRVIARAPGYVQSKGTRVVPGQKGVWIRLAARAPRGAFVVVDQSNGQDVTRFGLRIRKGSGAGASAVDARREPVYGSPRVREFGKSRVAAAARVGVDQVEVVAPGFARFVGDVDQAAFSERGQKIMLRSVPGLRGRIVDARGQGVAGQLVTLMFGQVGRVTVAGSDEQVPFDAGSDLARILKQQQGYTMYPLVALHEPLPPFVLSTHIGMRGYKTHTDVHGRFQFDVGTGVGRLVAARPAGARGASQAVVPSSMLVCMDGDCDVGDVPMSAPAQLRGRFVPSLAVDMSGSVVTIKSMAGYRAAVASDGAFAFASLPPGDHWFTVEVGEHMRSSKPWDHSWFVRLESGKVHEVEVPIEMSTACRLRASLLVNGKPAKGAVTFFRAGGKERVGQVEFGSDGRGVGTVEAGVNLHALVSIGWDQVHRSDPFVLPSGASERVFELSTAALEVLLPASFELPDEGRFRLSWRNRDGRAGTGLTVHVGDRERVLGAQGSNDLRVQFPNVPAGATACRLEFQPGKFYSGRAWQPLGSFGDELVAGASLRVALR